ncbi:sigma-70 family RNA polymerase sigma factor [Cellulomonas wangsupingiae]|uniref:sigma-70 family RNA polymerase sigma factor n=1 Tax=Cellulomonas wangsupingiae TaxID=2968085 RepID=UPI001D0EC0F7|nr:sigma-70 family RNA polymerase sigma factor [Cellulomonas wangsupingiae]MCM0639354.1 sigma-70 family RNA polymerase sigma factor [Cellulomonas wangsupingiae]
MTGAALGPDALAQVFEGERARLLRLAHRVLGSRSDAEDAVQEAWLRLARQEPGAIDNLGAWLTTVVGRVCLDMLRSRRAAPGVPHDEWLAGLEVVADDAPTPEDDAVLADSVGLALLIVLETLRPDERLAFVLHDVFAVPFEQIGQIIGRSTDTTKMLASRARRKVRGTPQQTDRQQARAVVAAFVTAARTGDFDGLLRVLDPDVTLRSHTARGVLVKIGATAVATAAQRGTVFRGRPVLVNGEPGLVLWDASGRPRALMACTVVGERIVDMVSILDPARLEQLDLPEPPPAT